MNTQYNDYIIDFERINKLTSHPNDNPNAGGAFAATFVYGITRKILKDYLEIFVTYNKVSRVPSKVSDDEYLKACEVLHFNKILVSKADIRDNKINNVLDCEDDMDDLYPH